MVDIWVQVVDSNGVDAKGLHEGGIAKADVGVAEGVLAQGRIIPRAATRLVGHADDLELLATLGVDKVVALNLQRGNSRHKRGSKSHESSRELNNVSI